MNNWQEAIDKNKEIFMDNSISFIKDSLFCEHAYILDLNTGLLEYYIGYQTEPDDDNRYGTECDGKYYPCKCIAKYDVKDINITETVEDMEMKGEDR